MHILKFLLNPEADSDVFKNRFLEDWGTIGKLRKPIIAAVSGYAVSSPSTTQLFSL